MRVLAVGITGTLLLVGTAIGVAGHDDEFLNEIPYADGVQLAAGVHVLGYGGISGFLTDPGAARDDPGYRTTDGLWTGGAHTSDPRVTGRWHWSFTYEHAGNTVGSWWGECGIKGPDGEWEGTCAGVRFRSHSGGPDAQEEWAFTGWYAGTGGYEGLTYYSTVAGSSPIGTTTGYVYDGPPPPDMTGSPAE